jgi:hypothetical protein
MKAFFLRLRKEQREQRERERQARKASRMFRILTSAAAVAIGLWIFNRFFRKGQEAKDSSPARPGRPW